MRHAVLTAAVVAAIAAGGSLMVSRAQATPLAAPSALQGAMADLNPATDVRYVCRMVRVRFGWRRACYWAPDRYYRPRPRPGVRFRF
jgi:hypothetical protein